MNFYPELDRISTRCVTAEKTFDVEKYLSEKKRVFLEYFRLTGRDTAVGGPSPFSD